MSKPPHGRPLALDATLAASPSTDAEAGAGPTIEPDADTLLGGVDTAQLRNAVQAKIFGTAVPPVRIGRYTVLRRVGRGGMGVVYSAYDDELDRKVAIKLISPGADASDRSLWERLRREAKALARLSDPGIVAVYEVGEHEGQLYIAMEYVDGITLRQWLDDEGRSAREIVAMFVQAARGLAAAHRAGLVHRDFKPDNAIIGRDGARSRLRVLDFGLALGTTAGEHAAEEAPRDIEVDAAQVTRTGALLGTPAYMAPEQLTGGTVDARTNKFAFCVALFEALWGKRPFKGRTLADLAVATASGAIVEPAPRTAVPTRVRRAVLRGLRAEPALRHASMDALVAELEHKSRVPLVVGLALVLALAGAFGWALWRAGRLDDEVASTRSRVETAEQALGRTADELLLAGALERIDTEPTYALADLRRLADAPRNLGQAWVIATMASARGVATHETLLPGEYDDSILLLAGGRQALLHSDEGALALRDPSAEGALALLDLDDEEVHRLQGHYGLPLDLAADGSAVITTRAGIGVELTALPGGEARMITRDEPALVELAPGLVVGLMRAAGSDPEAPGTLHAWPTDGGPRRELGSATFLWTVSDDGRHALVSDAGGDAIVELDGSGRRPIPSGAAPGAELLFGAASLAAGTVAYDVFGSSPGMGVRIVRLSDGARLELPMFGELAFDPRGEVLASGMISGGPRFVDVAAWQPNAIALAGPADPAAYGVLWSRSGELVLGCAPSGSCSVWSWPLRRQLATLRSPGTLEDVQLEDDGRVLIRRAYEGTQQDVHDDQGEHVGTFVFRERPRVLGWKVTPPPVTAAELAALAGGPQGLVTLEQGGAVRRWGVAPQELARVADAHAVAIADDGGMVVVAGATELRVLGATPRTLALPPADGRRQVVLAGTAIVVWDTVRLAVIDAESLRERWSAVGHFEVAPIGDELCRATRKREAIECVALTDGTARRSFDVAGPIIGLAASAAAGRLAAALDDGRVALVELSNGSQRTRATSLVPGRTMAFSPSGRVLALSSWDGSLAVLDLADDVIADALLPVPPGDPGIVGALGRGPAIQRIAFLDEGTLVAIDAWDQARAIELPPVGDADALMRWIDATTDVHSDP